MRRQELGNKGLNCRRLILLVVLGLFVGGTSTAWAQDWDTQVARYPIMWDTIGSVGIVDNAKDMKKINFYGGAVDLKKRGTVQLRYNITPPMYETPTGNLASAFIYGGFGVRFRDDGPAARVRVYLKAYNKSTGDNYTLWIADSDKVAPSDSFQTVWYRTPPSYVPFTLNFAGNFYYMDVFLSKTNGKAKAELGGIMFGVPGYDASAGLTPVLD